MDGKANEALVEFISRALGVPKRTVRIVAGEKSREKRVEVRGYGGDLEALLLQVGGRKGRMGKETKEG